MARRTEQATRLQRFLDDSGQRGAQNQRMNVGPLQREVVRGRGSSGRMAALGDARSKAQELALHCFPGFTVKNDTIR